MLKPACPRSSTPILALVLGKAGLLLAQVTVCTYECGKVPHIPFLTVSWMVCYVCRPVLSHQAVQYQCVHLQIVRETCNKGGQYLPDFLDLRAAFPNQGPALAGRDH